MANDPRWPAERPEGDNQPDSGEGTSLRVGSRRSPLAWHRTAGRTERVVVGLWVALSLLATVAIIGVATRGLATLGPDTTPPPLALASPQPSKPAPSADPSTVAPPPSPTPTPAPVQSAEQGGGSKWRLPDGWRYDLTCDDTRCVVHFFDPEGREQDGWPVAMPDDCFGWVVVGPGESAFFACDRNGSAVVIALGRDGRPLPGWPVRVPGSVAWPTWNGSSSGGVAPLAIGPDGSVFVAVNPRGSERFDIHAFTPDGTRRKGWPVTLRGGAQGFAIAPDGIVVGWWYEGIVDGLGLQARRTRFTMLDGSGDPLPGWPIGSVGAASGPVIRSDGSIAYTSATGKVWAHDRRGEIIEGWPYQLPYQVAPDLRNDGRLLFVTASEVHVVDARGRPLPGWPWRAKGSLDGPGCDVDSEGYQVYALDADDTLYVAPWRGSRQDVLALGADGRTEPGWPYRVPAGWRVTSIQPAIDGTVGVALSGGECFDESDVASLRLTGRGSLIGDGPGTPLTVVYDALRPSPLRTTDGLTSYRPGDAVVFRFELVNRAATSVTLPLVDYNGSPFYAAGTIQTWLERLGTDTEADCFPGAGRKEHWYATGGWRAVSASRVTIKPGGALPSLFDVTLTSDQTACLPPGDYRFHVEYKPLDGELEDVIAQRSLTFTIVEAAVPQTPIPTEPPRSAAPLTPSPSPVEPSPTPVGQVARPSRPGIPKPKGPLGLSFDTDARLPVQTVARAIGCTKKAIWEEGAPVARWNRGLGAVFVSLVVVGCATGTPSASAPASGAPASSGSPAAEPSAAGPTVGGEVAVSAFEDADTLDPTFSGTAGTRIVLTNMCEKLYDIDDSGGVVPQLATDVPTVNGLDMTIKVREGVKFNDGTPFDAAAVVKSLERHRTHPESKRAGELGSVASVTAADPTTVKITLSKPDASLVGALSDRAGMILSPAKLDELGDDFTNFPVCVGAFKFVERVVGDHTTLERSSDYYDAENVYLDKITIRPIADETIRSANLKSGDLQVVDRLATTDVAAFKADTQFAVVDRTSNAYSSLNVNIANANGMDGDPGTVTNPLSDAKLREAFDLALDRDQINQIVYTGLQLSGCGPLTPASSFYVDPGCAPRDIERAKTLVAESGVKTPIHVGLNMQATPVNTRLGELIQTEAAEAGFEVELIPLDNATAFQNQLDGKFDLSLGRWSGRVDPDGNIYRFHHTTGSDNYGKVSDAKIDELLDRARTEFDIETRKATYDEVIKLIIARRNVITFQHEQLYSAHTANLQGFQLFADGMPRLTHAYRSAG